MALYDDIISKDAESNIANDWSSKTSSIKLLQDHLQLKRTTQNLTKSNFYNNNNRKLPIQNIHNPNISKAINEIFTNSTPDNSFITNKSSSMLGGDWDVNEEYDPKWPNDYEKIVKEQNETRDNKDFDSKARKETKNCQITATRSLGLDYDDDEDEFEDDKSEDKSKSRASASIGPPPTLLENVEKVSNSAAFGVNSVAAKIMAKMGYREGQGLGKEEQGISKALQVEKIGKAHGKIIYEDENIRNEEPSITEMVKCPSRVVLLRNMVGPGEVDAELEPETKEECSKYGEVSSCSICELKQYDTEEEAVRIFVEFARVESAVKALVDLNGRYFGGRIVKASFYDIDRYRKGDLRI